MNSISRTMVLPLGQPRPQKSLTFRGQIGFWLVPHPSFSEIFVPGLALTRFLRLVQELVTQAFCQPPLFLSLLDLLVY